MGTIMILERAEITAKEGKKDEFVAVLQDQGVALIKTIPGVLDVRVGGGIESPDKVLLLVDWESLAAHEAFKKTPEYVELGKLIGPYGAGGAAEHFEMK